MFHFPGCPPLRLLIHLTVTRHYPGRVPPFGYSRIKAYLQLPSTFRSLSRPSSAISAMASTLRSFSLDLASSPTVTFLRLLRSNCRYFDLCFFVSSASLLTGIFRVTDLTSQKSVSFPVQFSRCVEVSQFLANPQNDTDKRFRLAFQPCVSVRRLGFAFALPQLY